jgi:hypothetical protein
MCIHTVRAAIPGACCWDPYALCHRTAHSTNCVQELRLQHNYCMLMIQDELEACMC